jgi:hypothetical protein
MNSSGLFTCRAAYSLQMASSASDIQRMNVGVAWSEILKDSKDPYICLANWEWSAGALKSKE